jgi:hypothetical protein
VGNGYRLWMSDLGWFSIDPLDGSISTPGGVDPIVLEERLWGIPAMLCYLARGDLPLHAAAIEIEGAAVILAAPTASGKTTLAAAAVSSGLRLLSEDVTCIRPGPVPSVIPGPAMLRVRPDVLSWLDVRHAAPVGDGQGRVHFATDEGGRGDCEPVPIRAIVLLRVGRSAGLAPVDRAAAIRDLWSLSSRIPTHDGRARCFEDLVDVVARVRVVDLGRTFEADQAAADIELIRSIV